MNWTLSAYLSIKSVTQMSHEFKLNNFDLIRIFAASQVMVQHSCAHLNIRTPFFLSVIDNFQGVPIFFVISGYLISSSFERNGTLKNYLTNRFLRIYPGLWACILLTLLTASIFGGINFLNAQTPPWLLAQMIGLIYTPHFLSAYGFGSYNGSLWTIPIELQFYLVLPILYYLLYRAGRKNAAVLVALLVFVSIAYLLNIAFPGMGGLNESKTGKLFRYTFMPQFYIFLTGVSLQRLKAHQSGLIYGKGLYWAAAYLLFNYIVPDFSAKFLASSLILAITTISLAYTLPHVSHRLLNGTDISYGVYIYHGIILNILVQFNYLNNVYYLFMLFIATYVMAFLSWTFIEKPILRRKRKTINTENIQTIPIKSLAAE